jgi:hypothetical protein
MSHFTVAVIMPPPDGLDIKTFRPLKAVFTSEVQAAINSWIEEKMAPYDENTDVDPYMEECYCIGQIARNDSEAKVTEMTGLTWEQERVRFRALHTGHAGIPMNKELQTVYEEQVWNPRRALVERLIQEHPMNNLPNPECSTCNGTGKRETTYNPKSEWDWYSVGGRWDGWLTGVEDPQAGLFNDGTEYPVLTRNTSTTELVDLTNKSPFAVITPDGVWHEKGDMGWFAIVSDEKDQTAWDEEVKALYRACPEHLVVCLDAHI